MNHSYEIEIWRLFLTSVVLQINDILGFYSLSKETAGYVSNNIALLLNA